MNIFGWLSEMNCIQTQGTSQLHEHSATHLGLQSGGADYLRFESALLGLAHGRGFLRIVE